MRTCEDVALSQSSPQECHFSPCARMGSPNSARGTLRHLPSVHRSETADYELLPEAKRGFSPKITHVYAPRGCIAGAAHLYESVAIRATRPSSPRTSASRARSSMRGKVPLRRTSRSTLWTLTWSTSVCVNRQHLVWFGQAQRMPKYRGNAQNGISGIVAGTDGAR